VKTVRTARELRDAYASNGSAQHALRLKGVKQQAARKLSFCADFGFVMSFLALPCFYY